MLNKQDKTLSGDDPDMEQEYKDDDDYDNDDDYDDDDYDDDDDDYKKGQ